MSSIPELPKFLRRSSWTKQQKEEAHAAHLKLVTERAAKLAKERAKEQAMVDDQPQPVPQPRKKRPRQTKADQQLVKAISKKIKRRKK